MPIAFPTDPFINNEILIEFAVMNPGADNGTWNPFSSVDFLRSDVFSYASGEGIATLWFRACTGGMMAVKGFGIENELVFLPLVDYAWSNIVISYNFGADTFALIQDGNIMFSGPLLDTFAPGWSIEASKADLTVFTGSQYAIDEVQRRLIETTTPLTYTLKSNDSEMIYFTTYQSDFPGAAAIDDTFDMGQAPFSSSFVSSKEVVLSGSGNSIIGTTTMGAAPTDIFYWEILVGDSLPMFAVPYVGTFIQAYGPPFDPETAYGGPLSCYYTGDGEIVGYGSSTTGNDTFTTGDVIGVVCNTVLTRVYFYKNGVQQAAYANMSNNIAQHMCGFGVPPS